MEYKLTGRIVGDPRDGRVTRRVKLQAGRFVLKESGNEDERGSSESGEVELLYKEVSGELARCVKEEDVS